jgi:membrane protease YdiL (CAAX protease family)
MGRIIQFPLTRIVLAFVFVAPVFLLSKGIKAGLYPRLAPSALIAARYLEAGLCFVLLLWFYNLYTRVVERRKPCEIELGKRWRDLGTGFLLSCAIVGLVVLACFLSRSLAVTGIIETKRFVADLFAKFFMGALIEELLFRLILFKLTEEWLGTWAALLIQALLFGFAHILNRNATLLTSLSVTIVGGLVYIAAYMASRSLWLPLGLHWGWNFAQSGIFSLPNSGSPYDGLLMTKVMGPRWLTGGSFGIEASYLTILLWLAVGLGFVIAARKRSQIVPPAGPRA